MKKTYQFSKMFLIIGLMAVLLPATMGAVPSLKDILSSSKDGVLKLTDIPLIKKIALGPLAKLLDGAEIGGLKLTVTKDKQELTGTAQLFKGSPKVDVAIKVVKDIEGNPGLSVFFGFPEGLTFSQMIDEDLEVLKTFGLDTSAIEKAFPGVKVTNVADLLTPLKLESGGVLLSTVDYTDEDVDRPVMKGVNITSTVEYGGFIKKALDKVNSASRGYFNYDPKVAMVLSLTPAIYGSNISIAVATNQTIGNWKLLGVDVPILSFDDNSVAITINKLGIPDIIVKSGITVAMPWHKPGTKEPETLDFIAQGELDIEKAAIKIE